jgi:hypothetical protein
VRIAPALVTLLAALLVPGPAAATGWMEGGKSIEGRPWQKSVRGFGAMLVLTDDPEGLLDAWSSRSNNDVSVPTTEVIERGKTIGAFVFFTGCQPDYQGLCHANVDYVILKPDGSEYAHFVDGELWRDKPPPVSGTLELGIDYIGVETDDTDPLGKWTVKALVRDQIATEILEVTHEFELIAPK